MTRIRWYVTVLAALGFGANLGAQDHPSSAVIRGSTASIGNRAIEAVWRIQTDKLKPASMRNRLAGTAIPVAPELFTLVLADGSAVNASSMRGLGSPRVETLVPDPRASRLADRIGGRQIAADFEGPGGVRIAWRAILRDGGNYLRQQVTFIPGARELNLREIILLDAPWPRAGVVGRVQGSPVVAGNTFGGIEHPLADSSVEGGRARSRLSRPVPLRPGQTLVVSCVIGVAPTGQLRRAFLQYLERERAHPYRPFLHYNSWYDIGYFPDTRYDEAAALAVVQAFGNELHDRRGVTLSSFLFDDGWDNPESLWNFNAGFPEGFRKINAAAARYGAAPGIWLSPWGGYNAPRKVRLAFGERQGYETNKEGFALSGPVYYQRFREVCMNMVRQYGVNMFKFDGVGRALGSVPDSRFGSDFEAAIQLIADLRSEKPDLFINLTTGTWPSPFWVQYADSIWRGGEDHDFFGKAPGSDRQRWITYRDAQTYNNIVSGGPLFPINSLMLHGLIFAKSADRLGRDPGGDFVAEVRSYFGTGTQLQEMYITPSLLSPQDWDALAEAANWSRKNAGVLCDTHWIGGDPAKLQVYGWASWTRSKGIIVLRNPGDRPTSLDLDVARAFELPHDAPRRYRAHSPWAADQQAQVFELRAGRRYTFRLKPFEVLTLDAVPAQAGGTSR
jgi:hypothetical protein